MKKLPTAWTRRDFLTALSIAGASTAMLTNPLVAWAMTEVDPKVARIVAATMGIDTHNHIDVPLVSAEVPGPEIDLYAEMKKSGLSAICMTFAVDYKKLGPDEGYERFINGLTSFQQQLKQNKMKLSYNLADLRAAHQKHQPTVVQSVEGAHFLGGKLERLEEAYGRGLRHLTLLHDSDASVPLGDVFTNPAQFGGLTSFGAEVIRECNRLGILVDLSHANTDTVNAALKVAKHPVLISHTGLDTQLGNNPGMARMMRPRLISKEQAKVVTATGGVIGVWTHLADSPLAYAENIKALVAVVGVDHVAIGTDTKLTAEYRGPVTVAQAGPQQNGRVNHGTNQTWPDQPFGFYYSVVDALLKTGFTEEEIGKIGGGNFCRVFDAATAGRGH